jgi:solute carrier family 25 carnitine/acylcarnitine transporter 20/29
MPSSSPPVQQTSDDEPVVNHLRYLHWFNPAELIPGMVAGALQGVLGHPLDTVKTRSQAYRGEAAPGDVYGNARLTSMQTARQLLKSDGVRGFYRGALPPILVNGSKRGVQLMIWEHVTPHVGGSTFIAGAIAGACGTLVSCPLHVIKIQAQTSFSSRSSTAAARELIATSGISSLYRGFTAHVIRDAGFAGAYLGTYGYFRRVLPEEWPMRVPMAAFIASMFTWMSLQPLDTLKTMRQTGLNRAQIRSRIFEPTQATATAAEAAPPLGAIVFRCWRGVGAALLRAGPVNAAAMVIYEYVREEVERRARRRTNGPNTR